MSFDIAIEQARAAADTASVPPWARIEAASRWIAVGEPQGARQQRGLAALASLAAAAVMTADAIASVRMGAPVIAVLALPVAVLLAAAALVLRRPLGGQLFARASWWAYLALGVVWSFGPIEALPLVGSLLAVTTGFALLAAGRSGTTRGAAPGVFDPIAFRGTVLLALLLAIAQVQLLVLLTSLRVEADMPASGAWAPALLALPTIAGVLGLLRLRLWGLLVLPAAALACLAALGLGLLEVSLALRVPLVAIAVVQLLLPLPILFAIHRGASPRARAQELPSRISAALVVALVSTAIVVGVLGSIDGEPSPTPNAEQSPP